MLEKHSIKVFGGVIWNSIPAGEGMCIILEIRDKDQRMVKFARWDCSKPDQGIEELELPNEWWSSLHTHQGDVLVFSRREDPINPALLSLWAFDWKTRTMLWEKSQCQFVASAIEGVWVIESKEAGPRKMLLDWRTGGPKEGSEFAAPANNRWLLPFHYIESDGHFETVQRFLKARHCKEALYGCDYCEWEGFIFISFYIADGDSLANFLMVVDADGEMKLFEKLESNLKAIGVSTFFIFENHLIFVKDKSALVSVPLKSFLA